jgi:uncharacterized spore protein YtfJ
MKKTFWLWVVAGIWLGLCSMAWAQNTAAQGKLIEQMVSQIKTVVNADSALGTPQDFQGTKVVPIVSMVVGFGSGICSDGEDKKCQGSGAGGGGAITPNGLLIVTPDGEVRVIAAKKSGLAEILKESLPVIIESMREKKEEKKKEEK